MDSVKQIAEETTKLLAGLYDLDEAKSMTSVLLGDVFEIDRADILVDEKIEIDKERLNKCVQRLLNNEPIQYVTGVSHFFGRKFNIKKGALIPRPETEELVQLIIEKNNLENPRILDVGVGSGCISISLSLELNGAVFGTDVSEESLKIAKENATILGATGKFLLHDIFKSSPPFKDLDILVSNPPYIPLEEQISMHRNVLDFEPHQALFVPDDDPLLFYKKISEAGLDLLKKGGRLYFEIHEEFAWEVKSLIENIGYSNLKVHQDLQGKDRMVSATN